MNVSTLTSVDDARKEKSVYIPACVIFVPYLRKYFMQTDGRGERRPK